MLSRGGLTEPSSGSNYCTFHILYFQMTRIHTLFGFITSMVVEI